MKNHIGLSCGRGANFDLFHVKQGEFSRGFAYRGKFKRGIVKVNISVQTLLNKMEQELQLAKSSAKQESLREKIYSIKILCELVLADQPAGREAVHSGAPSYQPALTPPVVSQPAVTQQVFQQPAALPQSKKLEMEEANGDSLFDF